jgi:hypothetical protein
MWAKQSTAATLIVGPILDSTGAEYTSAVIGDLSISKNGGTLTALASEETLTHIANGQYTLVTTTGNLDTLGRAQITCNKSTYQMPPVNLMVVPANVYDSMVLGSDALDVSAIQFAGQTITAAAGVTVPSSIASPTNITAGTITTVSTVTNAVVFPSSASINITGNITGNLSGSVGSVTGAVGSVTSGVTVSTNNDKTGYTASTVTDKTGYSLSQAFPSNFASLGINASGHISRVVLVDTVSAVTGLTASNLDAAISSRLAPTVSGRTLDVTATGAAGIDWGNIENQGSQVILYDTSIQNVTSVDQTDSVISLAAGATISGGVDDEIAAAVAATQALSRLDSMIESDGAGQFRFDTIALEQAPAGGGGGTDWTANERTAIRSILGVPTSGTTPTDPSVGILDTIRDKTNLITTGTIASSIPVTASGQIDGPLVIGDDYLSANGRAFIWTVALPSAFVIATSTCKFGMQYQDEEGTYSFNATGTVTDAGSGNVTLTFDVPKATTGLLGPGWYRWSVEIASASGTEVTRVKSSHNKLVEWVEKQT